MRGALLALVLFGFPMIAASEPPAPLVDLENAKAIHVLTQDADGEERKTKVWVAVVNGESYIRTGNTRWASNLERDVKLTVVLNEKHYPAVTNRVDDSKQVAEIDAKFRAKYGFQDRVVSLMRGGGKIYRLEGAR